MAPRKKKKKPVNKVSVAQALLKRYHDPKAKGSLGGVRRFAKAWGVPSKVAQHLLKRDLAYTLHKPRRRRFPTVPVVVGGLDDQWVADLVEVQSLAKYNRGIRYLLTVVDVLSKFAWVRPLKDKTGAKVVEALEDVVSQGRQPNRLQTDKGKEFYNRSLAKWTKDRGIRHFSTQGGAKASVVERFNRTLKQRLYRYFTAANTLRFDDALQDVVDGYNATPHRSIGMAPDRVTWKNEAKVWQRLYGKRLNAPQTRARLKVGDRVRLNKIHRPFGKGYVPGWTEEVSVVHRVIEGSVPTYKIREWDDTPVKGTFYHEDLQQVHASDDALFRIEKVLKRQKGRWLVKWKGWPDKYNSWIASADVSAL